jgi:hypothetical protein
LILRGRSFACHFQSQGQQEAATLQRQNAEESQNLFNIGEPYLKQTMNDFIKDLGSAGSEPASVKNAFSQIEKSNTAAYDQAEGTAQAQVGQIAKSSGYRGAAGATEEASSNALLGLEKRRKSAESVTKQQEYDAGIAQRDFDMSSILGIAQGGIATSFGYGRNAIGAEAYNTSNPGNEALTAATTIASIIAALA